MCSVVPLAFEQERQLSAACFNRFFLMTDRDTLFAGQVINKNRKKTPLARFLLRKFFYCVNTIAPLAQ